MLGDDVAGDDEVGGLGGEAGAFVEVGLEAKCAAALGAAEVVVDEPLVLGGAQDLPHLPGVKAFLRNDLVQIVLVNGRPVLHIA